ncbi:MAG TPA: hypothetical protein VIU41_02020 [Geobacteraceae bacterium]
MRRLQVVLGSSAPRAYGLDPAVRNCYVELDPPVTGDNTADAERLKAALRTNCAACRRQPASTAPWSA